MKFADKVIERYQQLRINPEIKYIVFFRQFECREQSLLKNIGDRIGATFELGQTLLTMLVTTLKG